MKEKYKISFTKYKISFTQAHLDVPTRTPGPIFQVVAHSTPFTTIKETVYTTDQWVYN